MEFSSERILQLRKMTCEDSYDNIFNLPIEKTGRIGELNKYCRDKGFVFIQDSSIYGGHWTDYNTMTSYLLV